MPYSLATNDGKYVDTTGNAAQWFEFIRDAFDMLYKEGATHPKMMSIGMHMRLVGHPSRAAGLERVLDHVMAHNDVWIARRIEIARHWQHIYPYSGKGLNEQETSMRP